jgi:DNA repair exonuclease SbcCD nuclease subunit
MKIVNISDLHFDAVTAGVSRFAEVDAALERATAYAIDNLEVGDLFVFTGDAADPDSGPIVLRAAASLLRSAIQLSEAGIDSIWVKGNHDDALDGTGCSTLAPLRPLGNATAMNRGEGGRGLVVVAEGAVPGLHVGPDGEYTACCLPYPGSIFYDPASALRDAATDGRPLLVFGHLVVPGLQQGEEAHEMARGKEVFFPVDALEEVRPKVALTLNGHHHRRQWVEKYDIHIPGSAARLRFGPEEGNPEPAFTVFSL